jgi:signal transduction histidine kinase/FixJ family two-component response regulator
MVEPLRALFVEDSEIDVQLIARQLRRAGYAVELQRVENEPDLHAALRASRWDVILSDYTMPHLNGMVALKTLKEKQLDIPFIVVSGTTGEDTAVELMKAGAHDFFIKGQTARLPNAIERELREAKDRQKRRAVEALLQQRARHQMAIAALGQRALTNVSIQDLFEDTVDLLTSSFEADCVRILELLSDDDRLFIRIDTEGQTGHVSMQEDSHITYTLSAGSPVLVEDVTTETRFAVSPIFMKCRSGISVLIQGRDRPFGILDTFDTRARTFTQDDIHFLQSIANILANAIINRQSLEAEIRAREAAQEADQLKTRFLGMVSHELRTPLTAIKGFLSTLLEPEVQWDTATQTKFMTIADQETDHLTELVEQLLDMTRISAGSFSVIPHPTSVIEVISGAIARLPQEANIELQSDETLPIVVADSRRIQQVLINILGNAIKFSPIGARILICTSHQGGFVQIDIHDDGPGIPPEDHQLVFEPFRQVKTNTFTKGAGLGLAISRGIIEAHSGKIWIQKRPLPGTTISFTLPIST